MSDFDDLLTAEPAPRKRGRPSNAEREARRAQAGGQLAHQAELRKAAIGQQSLQLDQFGDPVPQNFLARLLRMDPATVNQRLAKCRPAAVISNRKVYYFHEALPHLVKPVMSAEQFARTLNKADLPPEINKAFWDSQRSRVKYKIESQEAWETEDVMRVLGEVAMIFKDSTTMVVEEMRNRARLTDEQTVILQECMDELRKDIRAKLVDMPSKAQTPSMFGKPMFGVAGEIEREPDVLETGWVGDEENESEWGGDNDEVDI